MVEVLNRMIKENGLDDKIELGGTFCLGKCGQHVSVSIDEEFFSVNPEKAEEFFKNEILTRM